MARPESRDALVARLHELGLSDFFRAGGDGSVAFQDLELRRSARLVRHRWDIVLLERGQVCHVEASRLSEKEACEMFFTMVSGGSLFLARFLDESEAETASQSLLKAGIVHFRNDMPLVDAKHGRFRIFINYARDMIAARAAIGIAN